MTERGNKEKEIITVYTEPAARRKFKSKCALEGFSMSAVLEAFISNDKAVDGFLKSRSKKD